MCFIVFCWLWVTKWLWNVTSLRLLRLWEQAGCDRRFLAVFCAQTYAQSPTLHTELQLTHRLTHTDPNLRTNLRTEPKLTHKLTHTAPNLRTNLRTRPQTYAQSLQLTHIFTPCGIPTQCVITRTQTHITHLDTLLRAVLGIPTPLLWCFGNQHAHSHTNNRISLFDMLCVTFT